MLNTLAIARPGQQVVEKVALSSKLVIDHNPHYSLVVFPKSVIELGKKVAAYYTGALVTVKWSLHNSVRSYYVNAEYGNTCGGAVFSLSGNEIRVIWNGCLGYGATIEEALSEASRTYRDNAIM